MSTDEQGSETLKYLMRFLDGPLALRGNIRSLAGMCDVAIPCELFGWPLPDRLAVLCHESVDNVAMWDPENIPDGLPEEITLSPSRVIYRKVSEGSLSPNADSSSLDMRGAVYQLEGSQN